MRGSAVIPRRPTGAIVVFIEPEIAPFNPPTWKTLAYNKMWSGSDAPFARYSPLNHTVTLKLGFGSIKVIESGTIRLYIQLP